MNVAHELIETRFLAMIQPEFLEMLNTMRWLCGAAIEVVS